MAWDGNGGSEPGSSGVEKSFADIMAFERFEQYLLKMLDQPKVSKKFEMMSLNFVRPFVQAMVISIVQQEIMPAVEPLLRKVVNEESQKLLPGGTRNDVPKERMLYLKFSDDVLGPVHTSTKLRGIKDYPLKVSLLDETGQIVTCGLASATVEIVLTDANEHNTTHENFERKIIQTGDKTKPHFAKSVYINLKNGIGELTDLKLGQHSGWTKNYKCSLGVRLVEKFRGITVKEAWTPPFDVKDNRGGLYKNHDLPSLKSEVWRLKGINKNGEPRKGLEREKIKTVQDFLFWLNVNPEGLQSILGLHAGHSSWKKIVTHAEDCIIDNNWMLFHESSTEPQMAVIYDVVGKLKGVIDECHFVPIDNLSADKKDHASKLLRSVLEPSAFVDRYKTSFNDKASLLQKYPYKSSDDINASTNSSIQQCSNGNDLTSLENINVCIPTGPGSSSQNYDSGPSDPLVFLDTGEPCVPASAPDVYSPTDLGTLGGGCQNPGTCEALEELSITCSETLFHRVSSTMNYPSEDVGGLRCFDDTLWHMPDHNQLPTPTSPNPMNLYVDYGDFSNIQIYGHTHEFNADDGSAAAVEPQGVNTDDEAAAAPVEPRTPPPKRWKRVFCVVTLYSIGKRVLDVTPKQKRQKLG